MHVITTRDLIRTVADRWERQYGIVLCVDRLLPCGRSPAKILEMLRGLDPETATAWDVKQIIGNNDWTMIRCDHCGRQRDAAVTIGKYPNEATICHLCAVWAIVQIARAQAEPPDDEPDNRPCPGCGQKGVIECTCGR